MSKNSAKSQYTQLTEWLTTLSRKSTPNTKQTPAKFSKADHYKQKGAYGKASN